MTFTKRQRLFPTPWRPLAAALPVGLLLGFAGPFGSYPAFPTATRYTYWLGLTLAGAVAAVAADAALPSARLKAGPLRVAAVALLSAVPMTFVVAWTMSLVQSGRVYAPHQLPGLFVAVAAVQLLVVFATAAISDRRTATDIPIDPSATPNPPGSPAAPAFPAALLSRLAPGMGDILALETEDHYLRVHASGGSTLILMRMADAVALLDPRLGAQVHRRWWVAERAVTGLESDGQRVVLRLSDNTLVPIGRTFAAATRGRFASLGGAASSRS